MEELGRAIGARLRAGDLLVLDGPLGAGKTTLTRGIGAGLGVRAPITSPTFVLARTHPSVTGGPPLVHVDAYRLGSPAELDDLDLDFPGSVVVVEWGTGMLAGVSESLLTITIERPLGGAAVVSGGGADDDADMDEDVEVPVEPRLIRLAGSGPRWADGPWSAEAHSAAGGPDGPPLGGS
ncbi:tRNA (adenosine(37)-N6)-threonylcarbamoyltransferase complex ATPase subunit type 1 TsaE [uncultured Amnibacterium sp.]|uniref:tRNA (adenosine(37)-N6)-threonylcarbamoyltransferase complex ATPase subunit type 1 TsaE n=1 Tax=uncultured Amnibacterium sp. TaxID=1631851 RepID=UPI0035CC733C